MGVSRQTISSLENGISIMPDRYIPLIYPENNTVFEYLKDCTLVLADSGNMKERFQSIETQTAIDTENFLEEGFLNFATAKLRLTKAEFFTLCENALIFENFYLCFKFFFYFGIFCVKCKKIIF